MAHPFKPRHPGDEARLKAGWNWDEEAATKPITFIEKNLFLEDGRPFKVMPFHQSIIKSWYGWVRPDGKQGVKTGLLMCGRKNAKSALLFGLSAYELIAAGWRCPRVITTACDVAQAGQIYDWLANSFEMKGWTGQLNILKSKRRIEYPRLNGYYRAVPTDTGRGTALGHGLTFVCHDEMAFWQKDDMYLKLEGATAATGGKQIVISTAGWRKAGQFFKMVEYSRRILDGKITDLAFEPWLFEVPEEADLDEESNWYLSNPALGICQDVQDFRDNWNRANQDATTRLNWKRLRFCQFTESEDGWIDPRDWEACPSDMEEPTGKVAVGLDMGGVRDLTAVQMTYRQGGRVFLRSHAFLPEGALEKDRPNQLIYQAFADAGCLTITPGHATDEAAIIRFIESLYEKYHVEALVFDKWAAAPVYNHFANLGQQILTFHQWPSYYNGPCIALEALVNRRTLVHDHSPIMAWQIGHTSLYRDNRGYVKPITARPELKRDNVLATLMSLSQTLQTPEETSGGLDWI